MPVAKFYEIAEMKAFREFIDGQMQLCGVVAKMKFIAKTGVTFVG